MVQRALTVVVPATVVAAVGWSSGGYFPRSWGALLLIEAIGLAAVAILSAGIELGWTAVVLVGALLALAAWQLATVSWAVAPDAPVLEAERTLVYAGAAALALLAVPRARAAELVLAVLAGAGAITVGGLIEHALTDTADGRLELPIGYANASGILAATTLVLGLGLTASSATFRRALGGGLAVPAAVVLALSLSRGSILAALLGVVVLGAASTSLREVATGGLVAAPAAVAVALVSVTGRLDDDGVSLGEVVVLVTIAALSVAGAGVAAAAPLRRLGPGSLDGGARRRTLLVGACSLAALAVLAVGAYEVRQARSTPTTLAGAPDRLLSRSTSFRGAYWHVATDMVEQHPLLGAGAGGFARVWLRERRALLFVQDAHNLYLETLAELGPVGLVLLLLALASPLLAARRVTTRAAGRAALAAYVTLLAHAVVDWDWELPAVTLCTILLAASLVRLGGAEGSRRLATSGRAALLAGATVLAGLAIVVHAGNGSTADANDLLDRGNATAAQQAAAKARRYRPWAAEPWELLGEAQLAEGRPGAARGHLRRATREDPGSWSAWLTLALVTTGSERSDALARARSLNPLAPELQALSGLENP